MGAWCETPTRSPRVARALFGAEGGTPPRLSNASYVVYRIQENQQPRRWSCSSPSNNSKAYLSFCVDLVSKWFANAAEQTSVELKDLPQQERTIAEALRAYRRKQRQPLLALLDAHRASMPYSLYRGLRHLLLGKRGAPPRVSPVEEVHRHLLAIIVQDLNAQQGLPLEEAIAQVASLFGRSESIVKRAYLRHFPSPRRRSRS